MAQAAAGRRAMRGLHPAPTHHHEEEFTRWRNTSVHNGTSNAQLGRVLQREQALEVAGLEGAAMALDSVA